MKDFICPKCESHIRTQKHIPMGGKIQCCGCGHITTLTPENTSHRQPASIAPELPQPELDVELWLEDEPEPEPPTLFRLKPVHKPEPELHGDGKPLPPKQMGFGTLMAILLPCFLTFGLLGPPTYEEENGPTHSAKQSALLGR